jgi:hypothetical protein
MSNKDSILNFVFYVVMISLIVLAFSLPAIIDWEIANNYPFGKL